MTDVTASTVVLGDTVKCRDILLVDFDRASYVLLCAGNSGLVFLYIYFAVYFMFTYSAGLLTNFSRTNTDVFTTL